MFSLERFRSLRTYRIVLFLATMLLCAQVGAAMHPLHIDGKKSEVSCAFCANGSHLDSASVPVTATANFAAAELVIAGVQHVCDLQAPHTSRLTRGPPHFAYC